MIIHCECGKTEVREPFNEPDIERDDVYCGACLCRHFPSIFTDRPETREEKNARCWDTIRRAEEAITAGRIALESLRRALNELPTTERLQNELGLPDGIAEVAEAKQR